MMKRKGIFFTALMLVFSMLTASAVTKTAQFTKSFSKLYVFGGATVNYNVSNTSKPFMRITGEKDKIANLSFSIKGSTLSLGAKKGLKGINNGNKLRGVVITIYAPMVREIDTSSGAKVSFLNNITKSSGKIEIDASSGSFVSIGSLSCQKIDVEASSGAKINLGNINVNTTNMDVSSGANINCKKLKTTYLDCEATSGGSLKLGGTARNGKFSASSGGSIRGISFKCDNTDFDRSNSGSIRLK